MDCNRILACKRHPDRAIDLTAGDVQLVDRDLGHARPSSTSDASIVNFQIRRKEEADLALHAISQVPSAKLQQSWILTAPAGVEFVPTDILKTVGLRFPDEYEEVARARTSFMNEEHILWRPRGAKARSGLAAQTTGARATSAVP